MALLMAILVGVAIGALFSFILKRYELMLINMFVGVAGAIAGDAAYAVFGDNFSMLFSWGGLLCQIIGALLLLFAFELFRKLTTKAAEKVVE